MEKIEAEIKRAILEKYEDLTDTCTIANMAAFLILEKVGHENRLERVAGTVISDGETFDHEWLLFDGELVDITSEQFAGSLEYDGHVEDWPHMDDVEMEEAREIASMAEASLLEDYVLSDLG